MVSVFGTLNSGFGAVATQIFEMRRAAWRAGGGVFGDRKSESSDADGVTSYQVDQAQEPFERNIHATKVETTALGKTGLFLP